MTPPDGADLTVGRQLGNLEYVVDETTLAEYRRLVGEEGCYPNLLAEDGRALLEGRGGYRGLATVWQRFQFLRPPVLGRRIQVGGWLRESGARGGRAWHRVSTFAVDEIGTEILRAEAILAAGGCDAAMGHQDDVAMRPVAAPAPGGLGEAQPGGCRMLGSLEALEAPVFAGGPDAVNKFGLGPPMGGSGVAALLAGWLEGLLGREFGDDFRWGGSLTVAHHRRVEPGDVLTGDAVVMAKDVDAAGVVTRRMVIAVRNQANQRVASAEASVMSPSPRLL